MKKNDDFETEKLLSTLFLEVPSSVTLGALDTVNDISRKNKVPYEIFLNSLGVGEKIETLVENSRPIRLPTRKFDIKSRHRVRDFLLDCVDDMDAKDALRFLGKLIRSWLISATRDYLVCDRTYAEWKVYDRNADRISIIRDHLTNINRAYELNY